MSMSCCPQFNLWMVNDEIWQITVIAPVHVVIFTVLRVNTQWGRSMVSYHYIFLCRVSFNCLPDIVNSCSMVSHCITCREPTIILLAVTNDTKIIHHSFNQLHSDWVTTIHICPQCSADEMDIVNNYFIHVKKMNIRIILHFLVHPCICIRIPAMVKFVVAVH